MSQIHSCRETNGKYLSPQAQQLVFTQHCKGDETLYNPCHITWKESLSRNSIHLPALPRQDTSARQLRNQSACAVTSFFFKSCSRYIINLLYEEL